MLFAHTNFMGGGHTILVFIPFLFIVGALVVLSMAAGDRRSRNRSVRVLPVGAQHPLSHVRASMRPPRPPAVPPEGKPAARRRSEPPWLTPV